MRVIAEAKCIPPAGASPSSVDVFNALTSLQRRTFKSVSGKIDTEDKQCLEYYVRSCQLGQAAYIRKNTLWNPEYVVALLLEKQGCGDAIPEGWLQPVHKTQRKTASTQDVQLSNDNLSLPAPDDVPEPSRYGM